MREWCLDFSQSFLNKYKNLVLNIGGEFFSVTANPYASGRPLSCIPEEGL